MRIIEVKSLKIPEVKVIRFGRYSDNRGFFTEIYRRSDFESNPNTTFLKGIQFTQCNEAYSKAGTVRGLHFQWEPYMGKLVRVLWGKMIDMALDIRKGSATFGKIIGYEMASKPQDEYSEWIWLPPGFAHGPIFPEESHIEYFCTGQWNPKGEASISPLAKDIDWSICDPKIKKTYDSIVAKTKLITDKDKNGYSVSDWAKSKDSDRFIYGKV